MTDDDDPGELLAAELAFGLLDPAERAAAEARAADEGRFAALCERWRSYAAGMIDDDGEQPDPAIWGAIRDRLPANDDRVGAVALRRSVRAWRGASAALAVVALMAGGVALRRPLPVASTTVVAAAPTVILLTGARDAGVAAISYDPGAGRVTATSSGITIGTHAAELWVIPAGGMPHSLGVIRANAIDDKIEPVAVRLLVNAGATLAISVEPAGGSPTGQPTGPVILSGRVAAS